MTASKILTILFVILLIITIGEVGYYLSLNIFKTQTTQSVPTVQPIQAELSPTKTISGEIQAHPTALPTLAPAEEDDRRKMIKNGVLKSSVLFDTFDGILASIDLNGKVVKANNYEYRVKLGLKVGNEVIPIYLSKNAESLIKVRKSTDSISTPVTITLEDLKIGDHIVLERKLDTLKGDAKINIIDAQITRLND